MTGLYGTAATATSILALRDAFSGDPVALLLWMFAAFWWTVTGWEHDRATT